MEALTSVAQIRPTRDGTVVVLERKLGRLNGASPAQG